MPLQIISNWSPFDCRLMITYDGYTNITGEPSLVHYTQFEKLELA